MATTQDLLDQAKAAKHALLTGTASVMVQYGDRKMEFKPADLGQLERYIGQLQRQLAGKPLVRSRVNFVVPD